MKCYNCKQEIDNDSLFCDQCGQQVFICPDCHIPGKGAGKRCSQCGKPLVAASDLPQSSPHQAHKQAPHTAPAQQAPQTPLEPSRIVSREMGLTINLSDNLVIGRLEGPYALMLAPLKYLSARHASFHRSGSGWIIRDEGSRNGTAVNGKWCYSPLSFQIGDTIRLGDSYDFIVE